MTAYAEHRVVRAGETVRALDALSRLQARVAEWRRRQSDYHATLAELQALSSRELEDIGINPADVRRVAREAAGLR